jgi:hypothetical protein
MDILYIGIPEEKFDCEDANSMSINFYQTTRRHIPGDTSTLYTFLRTSSLVNLLPNPQRVHFIARENGVLINAYFSMGERHHFKEAFKLNRDWAFLNQNALRQRLICNRDPSHLSPFKLLTRFRHV